MDSVTKFREIKRTEKRSMFERVEKLSTNNGCGKNSFEIFKFNVKKKTTI